MLVEPNENAGAGVVEIVAEAAGVADDPNEKEDEAGAPPAVLLLLPKEKDGALELALAGAVEVEPNEKPAVGLDETAFPEPEVALAPAPPKPNENGFVAAGVPVGVDPAGLAPPKASCGADPPGPNLPNFAGDAGSTLGEGAKVLLSGVVA